MGYRVGFHEKIAEGQLVSALHDLEHHLHRCPLEDRRIGILTFPRPAPWWTRHILAASSATLGTLRRIACGT